MRWVRRLRLGPARDRLSDAEIEALLAGARTGRDELAELEWFVASIAGGSEPPANPAQMATALAATARTAGAKRRTGLRRRLVAVAASVAVLVALSGVAMAADAAAPGDFLYQIDLAFELIGVGKGGIDERIEEFDVLIDRGSHQTAFELLDEFAESASGADAERALRHMESAATRSNAIAATVQEKVAAKKELIDENKGAGVGLDRSDFGHGVVDQAQSGSHVTTPDEPSQSGEQPDHANNDSQSPPDHSASDSNADGGQGDDEPAKSGGSNSSPPGENSGNGGNKGENDNADGENAPQRDK